jgi:ketosteroid isomerase-like protein
MTRRSSRIAAVLFAFFLLATPAARLCAQQDKPHDSTEMKPLPQAELDVVKVLLAQERAWNKGDIDAFASGYKNSPDTLFIGSELYHGYDQMLGRYKKSYPDKATMGLLSFSDLQPRALDDKYAIVTGHFSLERDKKHGGPASGIFSLVFEKTDEGWKIILDHTS